MGWRSVYYYRGMHVWLGVGEILYSMPYCVLYGMAEEYCQTLRWREESPNYEAKYGINRLV